MTSIAIHLYPHEIQFASMIARQRNDKPARVNKRFTPDADDEYIDLLGALAEIGFAKYMRMGIDIQKRAGGDNGIDFEGNGFTVQIKARDEKRYSHPDLLCRIDYAKADYFVLAGVVYSSDLPACTVNLYGWINNEQLVGGDRINLGYGERYIARQEDLNTDWDFIRWLISF